MNSNKHKHLEFVQATINRMSSNSFFVKGWLVVIMAASIGLDDRLRNIELPGLIAIATLWYLDGYFLSLERRYRALYDHVRMLKDEEVDFSMNTRQFRDCQYTIAFSCMSISVAPIFIVAMSYFIYRLHWGIF